MTDRLLDDLQDLSASDMCPMHMPGHKRRSDVFGNAVPYGLDITEIDGFDDLHSSLWDGSESGPLHRLATLAADVYGCTAAFPLVGGSTVGILAAVRALTALTRTSEALVARNCHKSVYHAIELNRLTPHYLCPPILEGGIAGAISPDQVDALLSEHPDCRMVVLTSPTYEGVISPVAEIARVVHQHGGYLIVDGAHGAHLPFADERNPFEGADLTVVSLHKTLPAMTQTALLLVDAERVAPWRVGRELGVFETSSPSYPLMASIEECLRWVVAHRGDFAAYKEALADARSALAAMKHLRLFAPVGAYDTGKMVIRTDGASLTGSELCRRLRRKHHIELEMSSLYYVIAMTAVSDAIPTEGNQTPLERLVAALLAIDHELEDGEKVSQPVCMRVPERSMLAHEALNAWDGQTYVSLNDLAGRTAACYLWAYPPGVPLVVPGERFDDALIILMEAYARAGVALRCVGGDGSLPDRVPVLNE